MTEKVFIHAGAPSTGSSAFQMFLGLNATNIRAQGFEIAYPGRDGAQNGTLKMWLPAPKHDAVTRAYSIKKAQSNSRRYGRDPTLPLILSEENILGTMPSLLRGNFFSNAAARACHVKHVLAAKPIERLVVVVRPYDAFSISAYKKRAGIRQLPPFEQIAERLLVLEGGGLNVVHAFVEQLRSEHVAVVKYRPSRKQIELTAAVCPHLVSDQFVR